MNKALLLAVVASLVPGLCLADAITVTDNNSSLTFTRDDPDFNLGNPGDPMQLARKLEWNVDGRRILVYPSGPSSFIDIGHLHPDAHVDGTQMHAQGPVIGYDTGPNTGTVVGGIVYAVDGDTPGSGTSRLWEKVDIHNKSGSQVSLSLTGLGFKPTQASLEEPDLSGLNLTGTTVAFYEGSTEADSITDPPFGPVMVLPAVNFSGFNPLHNQSFSLPAGATLTMITELRLAPVQPGLPADLRMQPPGDSPVAPPAERLTSP